jgi:hypothetical protein
MTATLAKPSKNMKRSVDLEHFTYQDALCLTSHGVTIRIRVTNLGLLKHLISYLPPEYKISSATQVDVEYSLIVSDYDYNNHLYRNHEGIAHSWEIEDIFEALDSDIRLQIGILAKHQLFVHAGVVSWQNQAIVIPGRSFSGKTTLVKAFVKAGATYYSDEYAVLDIEGRVYPYPRPLSIRQQGRRNYRCSVEELGGKSGNKPIPIGNVVHVQYDTGINPSLVPISSGQGILALLDNTVVARLKPELTLHILTKAIKNATCYAGKRGEADAFAAELLHSLSH